MIQYQRVRNPLIGVLLFAGILLLCLCAYLIYLAASGESLYTDSTEHTCDLVGNYLDVYTTRDSNGIVVVFDYNVAIAPGDPLAGSTGECSLASECLLYHTSFSSVTCDSYVPLPSSVSCWTSSGNDTPVCVAPGSNWVGAMVGAIFAGLAALSFMACAFCVFRRPLVTVVSSYEVPVYPMTPVAPIYKVEFVQVVKS